ncbi:MAG: AAA family ATPase [Sphingomonas sp.]|nr:AAA family ATPase [Sphingomonas sp.]
MNDLVPVASGHFPPLDFVRLQREVPQTTPTERIVAGVYRQRYVVAAVLALAFAIGAYLAFTARPEYTAVASVQLDQQAPRVLSDPDLDPQSTPQDADRFLQTQLDRVHSRSIAERVAGRLAMNGRVLSSLGIDETDGNQVRERVIFKLQENVNAELGLKTRLAQIAFTSYDRDVSALIANLFAEALVVSNIDAKNDVAAKAKVYLLGQMKEAKGRLEASERQMLAYARSADLTTTVVPTGGEDKGGSLRAQQLGLMTDSLAQATARRIDAEQQWRQASGTPALYLPEVNANGAVQDLLAQKAQSQAALNEERQRHTDEYPSVREAQAKINELDGQIGAIANSIKAGYRGRYLAAAQQESQMRGTVAGMRGSAMAERERSVGYNSLQREVETNKAFYEGLLQRYKEVAAASGSPSANVTIVDRAGPPLSASSVSATRSLALAGISGLILALLIGSMRDSMHNVIRSCEDIEQKFNLQCLGVVPLAPKSVTMDEALSDPRSPQSEAYHSIGVALEEAVSGVLPKTLMITSSTAGEGKSTTAKGLASSLSAMGKRVLLVDADLRRASSGRSFNLPDHPGFAEALTGVAEPENAIDEDLDGYSVVRSGELSGSPVPLLSRSHVRSVITRFADEYDIVIFDAPPIMGLADTVLLARTTDAVMVVVEANRIHSSQLDLSISRLPEDRVIGAVLTKFDPRTAGVHYGGHDYYQY